MNSNMEKPYVVGIDIGGTNTVFGIVDARGTIIASSSIKTGAYEDVNDYVDEVCKNLLPLIIANGGVDKIKGIGIGAPNGNYYSGTIEFAPNLPWKGVIPLAAMFEERLGIPTALTNDANAAGIGEMLIQSHEGYIEFLPCLPEQWNKGSYKGLCVRGGAEVSADWNNSVINYASVKATAANSFSIKIPQNKNKPYRILLNGKTIKTFPDTHRIITIPMKAGDLLEIK